MSWSPKEIHWIMVFGGYADDLRTRPSAITSLSKMPRIRVLVIGHGLCHAGASQIAECKRVSRYLSGGTSYKPTSRQFHVSLAKKPPTRSSGSVQLLF